MSRRALAVISAELVNVQALRHAYLMVVPGLNTTIVQIVMLEIIPTL